jgi:hypothetical protein
MKEELSMCTSDDDPAREPDPGEVTLTPAGEVVVKKHEKAQPQPPDKTIHPRRPTPPVPPNLDEETP